MATAPHIADTIRTLFVAATVAFLGYLGYTLLRARMDNPPPQVVALEGDQLQEINERFATLRADTDRVQGELNRYAETTASRSWTAAPDGLGLPAKTRVEFGTVVVSIKRGKRQAGARVKFTHKYKSPPTFVCQDSGPAGTYTNVKAHKVTKTGCSVAVGLVGNWVDELDAVVGYVVIGEIE
ncbi:MAG: hypothetical protein GY842_12850 [bacterium]|nr:hypothetical protein [bacterium]